MNKEVRQEGTRIQRIVPIDLSGVIAVETSLHDNRPDVHAKVEEHDREETNLCATSLTDTLEIKYEAQTEASNDAKERRDKGGECAGADAEVGTKIGGPCTTNALSAGVYVSICQD